jgi:hypothetical protein
MVRVGGKDSGVLTAAARDWIRFLLLRLGEVPLCPDGMNKSYDLVVIFAYPTSASDIEYML